ncbi:MAG: SAM-dependent methyltransferase [Alkalilacustris sp.]
MTDAAPQAALRRYYEASTARFLAVGGSGRSLAIHRGVWDADVRDAEAAADRVNARIVACLRALDRPDPERVRDLGCGVGGSLLHFARAWPTATLEGITLSPRQAAMARGFAAERGLADRIRIHCGDFLAEGGAPVDLAVAVESHVHAPSAAAFLRAARANLTAGGTLVVVDDMLARPEDALTGAEARVLATFRRGWHLGHVPDADGLDTTAVAAGFRPLGGEDLTDFLRLDRWRDRALHVAAPLADAAGLGRFPLFSNMIGGNALTLAYLRGMMRYRLMVFEAT